MEGSLNRHDFDSSGKGNKTFLLQSPVIVDILAIYVCIFIDTTYIHPLNYIRGTYTHGQINRLD